MRRFVFLRPFWGLMLLLALLVPTRGEPIPQSSSDLLLILDASGSMWGQLGGENKIVIARRVLKELVAGLPDESQVGLVAYGHRRKGDCEDIEVVVAPGRLDKASLTSRIDSLDPKGKTPITGAVQEAFKTMRGRENASTVVLVSDGIETCGKDPCQAVREAKASGIDFVMHVVGFDVANADVSQLECAAQAGGGLYFDARNAADLAEALDQAIAMPADRPSGRLSVRAEADGKPLDTLVRVFSAGPGDGESIAGGRTYTGPETNPRIMPLPDGVYEVEVRAVGLKGDVRQNFQGIIISEGQTVEKVADFSTGELVIGVPRNGALSDAVVRIYAAGSRRSVAGGRSYTSAASNPKAYRVTAGTYDVEISSVEISGKPTHRWAGLRVQGKDRVERAHDFKSGTLTVGATQGGTLVDATINIHAADSGRPIAGGRTYTSSNSNPKSFRLIPGTYRITVRAVRLEGRPSKVLNVTVSAGSDQRQSVNFEQ